MTSATAAASDQPATRLTGISLPLSSRRSSSAANSVVVWKRFAGSGSRQRDDHRSSASGTSGAIGYRRGACHSALQLVDRAVCLVRAAPGQHVVKIRPNA